MKIKPPSRLHLKRAAIRRLAFQDWTVETSRKFGRLGQLNKFNKRMKRPSEFILMARAKEV